MVDTNENNTSQDKPSSTQNNQESGATSNTKTYGKDTKNTKGKKTKEKKKESWLESMMNDPLYRWFGWGGLLIIVGVLGYLGYLGYGVLKEYQATQATTSSEPFSFAKWWDGFKGYFTIANIFTISFLGNFLSFLTGFVVLILSIQDHISFLKKEHKDYKTLMTSAGLLGTFTGIFLGLLKFDVENIDGSVPLLLGGLKMAFITSIMAVFAVIVLSYMQAKPQLEGTDDSSMFKDMVDHLRNISQSQRDLEKMREALEEVQTNLAALQATMQEGSKVTNSTLARISDNDSKQATTVGEIRVLMNQINENMRTGESTKHIRELCQKISDSLGGSSGGGGRGGRSGIFG